MDTSEQYIKMCDCPEIQRTFDEPLHPAEFGYNFYSKDMKVWLPRQDQIQEMLGVSWVSSFEDFSTWYFNTSYPGERYPNDVFKSMEQMWLAFYMWEKYRKMWNGKKWVK